MSHIQQMLERNQRLISVKEQDFNGHTLKVIKYKREVFYKNLWNRDLQEFRGLVLDKENNIVSYPFTKIYNYGIEREAPHFHDDEMVIVTRKVNGFMVALTAFQNQLLVSTTGSVNSPFVQLAKDLITPELEVEILQYPDYTFLFECVHKNDPHIIPEQQGMYFLGKRLKQLNSPIELSNQPLSAMSLEMQIMTFSQAKELAKTAKHEGYVIYSQDMQRATKIKSKQYLVSKAIARASADKLSRLAVDEEFFGLMSAIKESENFAQLSEQERLNFIRGYYNV